MNVCINDVLLGHTAGLSGLEKEKLLDRLVFAANFEDVGF
jgi:hypothetical protein